MNVTRRLVTGVALAVTLSAALVGQERTREAIQDKWVLHPAAIAVGQQATPTQWLTDPSHAAKIAEVERDIPAVVPGDAEPLRLTLQRWMELYKIPGLSVAVFDQHALIWAKSYGVKEAGQPAVVTLDTLFQAGSISKPVSAMAALHFVEKRRWSLDEPINDRLVS